MTDRILIKEFVRNTPKQNDKRVKVIDLSKLDIV